MDKISIFEKISYSNPSYKIDGKKVICNLLCKFVDFEFTVVGTATCDSRDEFDERIGKSISLTKAQIKSRNKIINLLESLIKDYSILVNTTSDLVDKLNQYNKHDENYLLKFLIK